MSRITTTSFLILVCICGCSRRSASHGPSPREAGPPRGLSQSAAAPDIYEPAEFTHTGRIHTGCVDFRDPEEIVGKGPITRVDVLHGGYIHGIRLWYGKDGQGLLHAGPEEKEAPARGIWKVPDGERIVRIEGEIAGNYISRLKFITNRGTASPQFGGVGVKGKSFVVTDRSIGGLRTITGSVNRRKHPSKDNHRAIASMTFHFGAPCYVKEIKYDQAALEAASLKAAPQRLTQQEIPNRTSAEQSVVYTDTKKIETTRTLSFNVGVSITLGREVSVGLPGQMGATAKFEATTSMEAGRSYENKSAQEVQWSVPVRVPPGKKVIASSTVKRYQADIPFTCTIAWYWGTRDNILKEATVPGVYKGLHVEDLKHEFKEVPLD